MRLDGTLSSADEIARSRGGGVGRRGRSALIPVALAVVVIVHFITNTNVSEDGKHSEEVEGRRTPELVAFGFAKEASTRPTLPVLGVLVPGVVQPLLQRGT